MRTSDLQRAARGAQVRWLPLPRTDAPRPSLPMPGQPWGAVVVTPPRYALAHALTRSLGKPLVSGNRVELLAAGEPARAALFAALERARDHINLECPAFMAPGFATSLAQRLMARAGAGVAVHLIPGSAPTGAARDAALLRHAGIRLCPSRWLPRLPGLLVRGAGRGLVVVDGSVAFVDGLTTPASAPGGACLRIEGPAVAQLQALFIERWQRRCGAPPPPARYFPALVPCGGQRTGLAACDAGWAPRPLHAALLAALDTAQERVRLGQVPGPTVARALVAAAARGVDVELLLPAGGDGAAVRQRLGPLLAAGVRAPCRREAPPPLDACVVDGTWAAVGLGPGTERRLHGAETAVIVLDAAFGAALERRLGPS